MEEKSSFRTELLTTVEELKDFCRDNDIVMGKKRKAQLIAAIRSEGLWQAFCETVECEGCEIYEPKCRCTAMVVELRAELKGLCEKLSNLNASNAIIVRPKTTASRGTMMAVLEELSQNEDLSSHFIDEDGDEIR